MSADWTWDFTCRRIGNLLFNVVLLTVNVSSDDKLNITLKREIEKKGIMRHVMFLAETE
jgi:hypothetical protein